MGACTWGGNQKSHLFRLHCCRPQLLGCRYAASMPNGPGTTPPMCVCALTGGLPAGPGRSASGQHPAGCGQQRGGAHRLQPGIRQGPAAARARDRPFPPHPPPAGPGPPLCTAAPVLSCRITSYPPKCRAWRRLDQSACAAMVVPAALHGGHSGPLCAAGIDIESASRGLAASCIYDGIWSRKRGKGGQEWMKGKKSRHKEGLLPSHSSLPEHLFYCWWPSPLEMDLR